MNAKAMQMLLENPALRAEYERRLADPSAQRPVVPVSQATNIGAKKPCGSPCGPKKSLSTRVANAWTLGWNFAAAVKAWSSNGKMKATKEQYEERRAICADCPSGLRITTAGADRCGQGAPIDEGCGCLLALKAAIVEHHDKSDCPKGHWPILWPIEPLPPEPMPEKPPRVIRPAARVIWPPGKVIGRIETDAQPFTGPITRNLLFHVYPLAGNGVWQRHAEELRKRLHLFNGRRVVAIAIDAKTDAAAEVQRVYADIADKFIVVPNSGLREVVTFKLLWSEIDLQDHNAITFFAHGKGVTKPVNPGVSVHRWADLMYEVLLDHPGLVEDRLQQFHVVGTFQRLGRVWRATRSDWHYSGAFYWVRNREVGLRLPIRVDNKWWGVESWPGLMFQQSQAACLFDCGGTRHHNMYSMRALELVEQEYAEWKQAQYPIA